jgi:hypothetical protein
VLLISKIYNPVMSLADSHGGSENATYAPNSRDSYLASAGSILLILLGISTFAALRSFLRW